MTVETTTNKVTANGNDVATSFSFSPMVIFQSSDLVVVHTDAAGVETTLTEGVGTANYAVVVVEYPGTGSITYPASGTGKLATGEKLTMKRVLALEQTLDLENQGGYLAENQETAFDKLTMICLQQQEELDRAVKVEISSDTDPASLIAEIISDTAAAAASATASAASATAAAASETSAAASASAAAATLAAGMFSAVQDKSADYAVVEGDAGDLLRVDAGAGGVTITLPSIAGLAVPEGFKIAVTKWAGAGSVTIIRSSTDTINGANSYVVPVQYETVVLVADSQTDTWAAIDQSPPLVDHSVTMAKIEQLPALTLVGNDTGATANAKKLTTAQVRAVLTRQTRVTAGTNTSMADNAYTAVVWDVATFDDDACWSVANPTRVTIKTAGRYKIRGQITFDTTSAGTFAIKLRQNNTGDVSKMVNAFPAGTVSGKTVYIDDVLSFAANDYMELYGFQNTGAAVSTVGASVNTFLVVELVH